MVIGNIANMAGLIPFKRTQHSVSLAMIRRKKSRVRMKHRSDPRAQLWHTILRCIHRMLPIGILGGILEAILQALQVEFLSAFLKEFLKSFLEGLLKNS